MLAFVSGRAAVAVIQDGDDWYSLSYDQPNAKVRRTEAEAELLLRSHSDVATLEDHSIEEISDHL